MKTIFINAPVTKENKVANYENPTQIRYLVIAPDGKGYEGFGIVYGTKIICACCGEVYDLAHPLKGYQVYITKRYTWQNFNCLFNSANTFKKYDLAQSKYYENPKEEEEDSFYIDLEDILDSIQLGE